MGALRKHIPSRMTVDEFLVWDPRDRSGRLWQLIDGEPVAMAPSSARHGEIQGEIAGLLRDHLLRNGTGCRVIVTPGVVPRIGASRNFRIPDLGVSCSRSASEHMVSEPVVLIEVLSPSNEAETHANVWAYTTIPSVREILTVRATRIEAELLVRGEDGNWPAGPAVLSGADRVVLASIGFSEPLAAFYRTTELG